MFVKSLSNFPYKSLQTLLSVLVKSRISQLEHHEYKLILVNMPDDTLLEVNHNNWLRHTKFSCTPDKDTLYLKFYPGIENLILPMLSYPGRQATSSCETAS